MIPLIARLVWFARDPAKSSVLIWLAGMSASVIKNWVHWSSNPNCQCVLNDVHSTQRKNAYVCAEVGIISRSLCVAQRHDKHVSTLCFWAEPSKLPLRTRRWESHLPQAWVRRARHYARMLLDKTNLRGSFINNKGTKQNHPLPMSWTLQALGYWPVAWYRNSTSSKCFPSIGFVYSSTGHAGKITSTVLMFCDISETRFSNWTQLFNLLHR